MKRHKKHISASIMGVVAGAMGIATHPANALAATALKEVTTPKSAAAQVENSVVSTALSETLAVQSAAALTPEPQTSATTSSSRVLANSAIDLQPSDAITTADDVTEGSEIITELTPTSELPVTASDNTVADTNSAVELQSGEIFTEADDDTAESVESVSTDAAVTAESSSEISEGEERSRSEQTRILNPSNNAVLDVPATTVIVEHPTDIEINLLVNGQRIDASLLGRTEVDESRNITVQTWYGVPMKSGTNQLEVVERGSDTSLTALEIQVRGVPSELTVGTREAQVPADGRSTATVYGQLLDQNGNQSNWNTTVTLTTTGGDFIGVDQFPDQPGFQVEAQNGRYTAELQAPLNAEQVQLRATANSLEAFSQIQFETQQRPSLVTGVLDLRFGARGTDYYSSFQDFLPPNGDNRYELDVDASVFAIGNIGEWLFTGAYNSDRPLNEDCTGSVQLFRQTQSCDHQYPTYGDDSTQDVTAPSIDNLYLRFERTSPVASAGTDYVMWGDFNTEEFATSSQLFTATTRQLHGFKLNYNIGDLAITGFYGNNVEGFQRDTIAPDGTSGYYFLSRRLLVPGSENVFIELEELDRPGTVVSRQPLYRGTDYEIDYDRGAILFRDPILRTDVGGLGSVLVRRIVTTYQYEGQDTSTNIYAGRLQYNLDRTLNQESWLGATYLLENQGVRSFELYGADIQIFLGPEARLTAEFAHSASDFELSGPVEGSAYRVELEGAATDWLRGRAYWRHTDPGFTNNATTSFVPGQTRYGAEAAIALSDNTSIRARYDREENEGTAPRPLLNLDDLLDVGNFPVPGSQVSNSLDTFSLGFAHRLGDSNLEFDWLHRERTDRLASNALSASSDQLRTRLTTAINEDITLVAQNEINLSSNSDPLYPNRTIFGLNWRLMPGLVLGVNQIFQEDQTGSPETITTVDLSGEYALAQDTTIHGRFSLIEGQQVGGAIGLEQGFTLAPGLKLDLAYEHIFNNFSGSTAAGTQFTQPFAVGDGASSLLLTNGDSFSVGLSYTDNPDLQASARFEHRSSSQGSNTVLPQQRWGGSPRRLRFYSTTRRLGLPTSLWAD
ncbi:MAG: TonB-dependent receptor [Leptolyngbyaceae cyanobacterium RM2_2_21]|nr:TonB-dependent receptor [Leptolyngbyaceae cyanobacterium RM2_2_21]